MKLTFIDFFAGIGGFRKGLENAGHKCIGFCEFDKFAVASYTSMHLITDEQRKYLFSLDFKTRQKEILKEEYRNGEWYCDDIKKVNSRNIPKADCWCFGSPCFVAGTLITTNNGMKPIDTPILFSRSTSLPGSSRNTDGRRSRNFSPSTQPCRLTSAPRQISKSASSGVAVFRAS